MTDIMKACSCGCTKFRVRMEQVVHFHQCIDINTGETVCVDTDDEYDDTDICNDTVFVCDECEKVYQHYADIPERKEEYV